MQSGKGSMPRRGDGSWATRPARQLSLRRRRRRGGQRVCEKGWRSSRCRAARRRGAPRRATQRAVNLLLRGRPRPPTTAVLSVLRPHPSPQRIVLRLNHPARPRTERLPCERQRDRVAREPASEEGRTRTARLWGDSMTDDEACDLTMGLEQTRVRPFGTLLVPPRSSPLIQTASPSFASVPNDTHDSPTFSAAVCAVSVDRRRRQCPQPKPSSPSALQPRTSRPQGAAPALRIRAHVEITSRRRGKRGANDAMQETIEIYSSSQSTKSRSGSFQSARPAPTNASLPPAVVPFAPPFAARVGLREGLDSVEV